MIYTSQAKKIYGHDLFLMIGNYSHISIACDGREIVHIEGLR